MSRSSNRQLLSLVFAVTLVSMSGNTFLAPVVPDVLADFARPAADGGLLIAASSLPGIFVAPVAGFLADRWGRRPVLVTCLTLFGAFGLAAALAPSFAWLLIARLGMGVGGAALINLAAVLIGDRFEGAQRTHWIGRNAGVLTIGLAVVPPISGFLERVGSWRLSFAPYGLALVVAGYAWIVLDAPRQREVTPLSSQARDARFVLTRPLLVANFVAGAIAFAVIFGVFLGAGPTVLEIRFGLDAFGRGLVLTVPALSSVLVAFNLGRIQAKISRTALLIGSATIWIVAFALMGLTSWLWLFVFGAVLYGPGEGAMIPVLTNAALDRAPQQHRAVVLAMWTASARLGQTIGPIVAAQLVHIRDGAASILLASVGSASLVALFIGVHIATSRRPNPQR